MNFKEYFLTKLKVLSFILSLFGILLLFIFLGGFLFPELLKKIELVLTSNIFIWAIRIVTVILLLTLLLLKEKITLFLNKKEVQITLKLLFIAGGLGWLLFFVSLLIT